MEGLRKISSQRLNFSVAWGLPKLGYPSPKSSRLPGGSLRAGVELSDRGYGQAVGGLSWPSVPSCRPSGLSTDPQAARGRWDRRGLERAVGAHPLPNTPSTQPAPRKGRGRDQRDLDKGWDQKTRGGTKGGGHGSREDMGATWSTFLSVRKVGYSSPPA